MAEFLSPDEIAQTIFDDMADGDRAFVMEECPSGAEQMIRYHHGMGTAIRNDFGLWDDNNPYTKVDVEPNAQGIIDDPMFPDQVSHQILMRVWELIKNEQDNADFRRFEEKRDDAQA